MTVSPSTSSQLFNFHRQRDVIGVFADDRTHAPVVEEIVLAFAQVQRDLGTAIGFVNVGNGIFAFASGFPEDAVFGAVAAARVRTVTLSATINAE